MRKTQRVVQLLLTVCVLAASISAFAENGASKLDARIAEIAANFPGTVGVYARNLETGEEAALNPDRRFPMASVYKIPIMTQVFRDIDAGKLSIDERIEIGPEIRVKPGSGLLRLMQPGLQPTISDLLYLMLTISDNAATDLLLERVGAANVTATLREMGLQNISVDRPTAVLIRDWLASPNEKFLRDERDQSSPRAMAELLAKIANGEAASAESCKRMLEVLRNQQFRQRLPRYLPGVAVLHKTGTIGYTTNDAGIIDMKTQRIAIAVFTEKRDLSVATIEAEETIGQIARAVYDYFNARELPAESE